MSIGAYVVAGLLILSASPASAKSVTLQTVDLNDRDMSTEGGLATLYRVTSAKGAYCRIAVTHFGETGRTTLGFAFSPRLFSAVIRQYRYNLPIYMDGGGRIVSVQAETLQTKQGAAHLPDAFKEYRSFFNSRQLAKCSAR